MSVKTWMPIYWGDYLRDTAHLSASEHGAYLLMIGHYWTTAKPLPDHDEQLRRIARMEKAEWKRARLVLEGFFTISDGVWRHSRIDAELVLWGSKNEFYKDRASNAARKRWACLKDATSMPEAMLERCPPPSPSSKEKETTTIVVAKKVDLRGSRIPEDFTLDERMFQWGSENGVSPSLLSKETEKFRDYWASKAGADARKTDWFKTWCNWMRRAAENQLKAKSIDLGRAWL